MLVLTRKSEQKIHIGPDITITVLEIQGSKVRIGIEAPRDVTVLRSELCDMLQSSLPTDKPSDPALMGR